MNYYIGQILNEKELIEFANYCAVNHPMMTTKALGNKRYEIEAVPPPSEEEIKQRRIAELKAQLDGTDYKIIKCSECSLAGVELPYDIAALHAERQALRDEINQLEGE